jgi:hypothetical protein
MLVGELGNYEKEYTDRISNTPSQSVQRNPQIQFHRDSLRKRER